MVRKKIKFDIRKHVLVPKQTRLGPKQKKDLLEKLNATVFDLPKISASDPAIQELGAEVGDVIMVERQSPTAGKTVYYRGVTNE